MIVSKPTDGEKKVERWKVEGIWPGSFNDTLAKLCETHRNDELEDAVILFRRRKPEGGFTVFRNFVGDPFDCHGLLKFAESMINHAIEDGMVEP